VLDVGCGGGDTARRLREWGRSRGLDVRVTGIDLSPSAIAYARRRHGGDEVEFRVQDLFALPEGDTWDVVHSALTFHHFSPEALPRALAAMHRRARLGVAVNDLERSPVAYYAALAFIRFLCRGSVVANDGPISVLRAFTEGDLRALARDAGVPAPELSRRWAFRWRMLIRS
jgi:SAM-dependent methyltransferase